MSSTLRIILVLTLILAACGLSAQETATTATETTATSEKAATTTAEDSTAEKTETATTATSEPVESAENQHFETRAQFRRVLERYYSADLSTVLALEPGLLANEEFVKGHPALAQVLDKHPEIAQHPDFYLADISPLRSRSGPVEDLIEALTVSLAFVSVALALAWFVRTVIEQKRWNRLSRQQSEVHNKILDRFGNNEEVLQYMKTPAGAKFLESAPIPLYAERPAATRPSLPRGVWSIQAGVVVAAGAIGLMFVSLRYTGPSSADLFSLGAIGFCVGVGFIASSLVSFFISRRLASWQPERPEEPETMR